MAYMESSGDLNKTRSPQYAGQQPLQQHFTSGVQRSSRLGHSQHSSPRHTRERSSRKRPRDSTASIYSMDAEDSSSTLGSIPSKSRERSVEEPKPANVVSDIARSDRTTKRTQSAHHNPSEPNPKRPKTSVPIHKHEESEDELHTNIVNDVRSPPSTKKHTALWTGPPTATSLKNRHLRSKPPTPSSSQSKTKQKGFDLNLTEAVGGRQTFTSTDGKQTVLRQSQSDSNVLEPWTATGERLQSEWLNIHVPSAHRIYSSATNSPIVILHRSGGIGTTPKLALRFASQKDAALFVSIFDGHSQQRIERSPERLQQLLLSSKEDASKNKRPSPERASPRSNDRSASYDRPTSNISTPITRPTTRREVTARQTRSSLPEFSYRERQTSPYRWTDNNPGWELQWKRSLVYPATGRNRATVDKDDVPRLDEGEFLNDNLISFYLRYLQVNLERNQPDLMKRIHIFSTFFFEKLASQKGKINYDGVKSWTSKVDIFSFDYLIVPVNENAHWYLAIICNVAKTIEPLDSFALPSNSNSARRAATGSPRLATVERGISDISLNDDTPRRSIRHQSAGLHTGTDSKRFSTPDPPTGKSRRSFGTPQKLDPSHPRIITLDSLGDSHSPTCSALRQYLAKEAEDKRNTELTNVPMGLTAKGIPHQNNYCDCGIYVLAYAAEFLKDPDATTRKLLMKEPLNWDVDPSTMRKDVRSLLFELRDEQRLANHKSHKDNPSEKCVAPEASTDKRTAERPVSSGGRSSVDDRATSGTVESKYFAKKSKSMDLMPRIATSKTYGRLDKPRSRDIPILGRETKPTRPASDVPPKQTKPCSTYDGIERSIPID